MSARSRHIARVIIVTPVRAVLRSRFGFAPVAVRRAASAESWREAFEELGGAFIKLGQMISVRPDEFGEELAGEMECLRDRVCPVAFSELEPIIEASLGAPTASLYESIDATPLATASIAQVHAAVLAKAYRPVWGQELPAGAEVVVKVIRPGAAESLRTDVIEARRLASNRVVRWFLRGVDLDAMLDEFAVSLERELDLRVEGKVADRFAFDFRPDPKIAVPRIVWSHSAPRVLTMERMYGWRLSELSEAELAGVDAHTLAVHGATA
ncbi:MAG TPA: AarF/UbiB family protein, partial [Coriobacteriia bacterium]|nr:AarF/UbiB family protein [Coriobacteriia bacterium]